MRAMCKVRLMVMLDSPCLGSSAPTCRACERTSALNATSNMRTCGIRARTCSLRSRSGTVLLIGCTSRLNMLRDRDGTSPCHACLRFMQLVGHGVAHTAIMPQHYAAKLLALVLQRTAMVVIRSRGPSGSADDPELPEPEPDFEPDTAWELVGFASHWASFVRGMVRRAQINMRMQMEQERHQERQERVPSAWALFTWALIARVPQSDNAAIRSWHQVMTRIIRLKRRTMRFRSYWGWAGTKVLQPRALVDRFEYAFRPRTMPVVITSPDPIYPAIDGRGRVHATWWQRAGYQSEPNITTGRTRRARSNWARFMSRVFKRRFMIMRTRPWWGLFGQFLQRTIVKGIVREWCPH